MGNITNFGIRETKPNGSAPPPNNSELPSPVFVVGLPKCGTTTLQRALESVSYGTIHCYAPKPWGRKTGDRFVGHLMAKAVGDGRKPLAYLPQWVNAMTQMGCWWIEGDSPETEKCYAHFPQITLLESLASSYPDAKFILCDRSTASWLHSVNAYGPMRHILDEADLPRLPNGVRSGDTLARWFEAHNEEVRRFFKTGKFTNAGALLELELEKSDQVLKEQLSDFLGGAKINWGWYSANSTTEKAKKGCDPLNATVQE